MSEAVLNVFDCWFDDAIFDNRYEAAIRSWGQQAPEIAAELADADAQQIVALTAMFARFGYAPLEAQVRAPNHAPGAGSVEDAAREPVRLALLDASGPTGTFSNAEGPLPW